MRLPILRAGLNGPPRDEEVRVAYDEELAERVRAAVAARDDVDEKPMFGGLCLLAHGNMFAGVLDDRLMLRVGPEAQEDALRRPHTRVMDFTGRPLRGYVYVDPPGIAAEPQLREWLELGLAFADTLPAK